MDTNDIAHNTNDLVLNLIENIKKSSAVDETDIQQKITTEININNDSKKELTHGKSELSDRFPNSNQKRVASKLEVKEDTEKFDVLRGRPKSGRFWKAKKERFSSIVKTKGIKPDFKKKTALRIELKRTKELSKQIQEEMKEKEQVRKERRRLNIKHAEDNKKKSEIVQIITNSAKLKRMKKKQLRFIEKRDTNK